MQYWKKIKKVWRAAHPKTQQSYRTIPLLGHTSIKTTMDRYVHVTSGSLSQAVLQFESNRVL